MSIYAAYLYDSVLLYATALDKLLKDKTQEYNQRQLSVEQIEEIASNGTEIIQTIIKQGQYRSITGSIIKLDKHGDSEGNFSVLALKPYDLVDGNFSCEFHMIPVGQFQYYHDANSDFPVSEFAFSTYNYFFVNQPTLVSDNEYTKYLPN